LKNDADRAHNADQSKALHPDWRDSSGIALPTVEELHYAHHFLNRAVERRLKEFSPTRVLPRANSHVVAMEAESSELGGSNTRVRQFSLGESSLGKLREPNTLPIDPVCKSHKPNAFWGLS
jgi:hypothetical protein